MRKWLLRRGCAAVVCAGIGLATSACEDRSEHSQPRQASGEGAISVSDQQGTAAEVRVPSAEEMAALLALQDRVALQPGEMALRRALGAKAIDTTAGVVWSVGRGRLPAGAEASAVARSNAELAARLDAARWAGYLLTWHKNDYATPFGTLHTQVPGGTVASTVVNDSVCVTLVMTPLQ